MELYELFQKTVSLWIKYSEYDFMKSEDGTEFIVPGRDASFSFFEPVDCSQELVVDALNAGQVIFEHQDDTQKIKDTAFAFTRKYGPLGWLTALPMDRDFYNEEQTWLGRNGGFFGKKIVATDEFIAYFLKGKAEDQQPMDAVAYAAGREKIFGIVFSKKYGEPILWLAAYLQNLYEHFFSALNYNKNGYTPDEAAVLKHNATLFDNEGISFYLTASQHPEMKWEFDSLKAILETAYSLYITDESKPLKMCKHCGKAFYNTNPRSEFCSVRCRNQWNVYKSRGKKSRDLN